MAGIIWDEGFARVTDLAGRFGVSAVTVRADLTALEATARVRRVRGGAVPPSGAAGGAALRIVAAGGAAPEVQHRCPRRRDDRRRGQFFTDYNLLSAGSILVAIPVLVVFFLLQKQFVAGLTLGATKG